MTKGKRALIWTGSIFAIVAVALAIFISTLDQNKAKKYISAAVTEATGRQLSIKGDLNLDKGAKVSAKVHAANVTIGGGGLNLAIGLTAVSTVVTFWYFKKKKWF